MHAYSGCITWGVRNEWTQQRVWPSESENPADRPVCVFFTEAERSVTVMGETWELPTFHSSSWGDCTDLRSRINLEENTFYLQEKKNNICSLALSQVDSDVGHLSEADRSQRDTGAATNRSNILEPGRPTGIGPRVPLAVDSYLFPLFFYFLGWF